FVGRSQRPPRAPRRSRGRHTSDDASWDSPYELARVELAMAPRAAELRPSSVPELAKNRRKSAAKMASSQRSTHAMDTEIRKALGDKAGFYLDFATPKIAKSRLHLPGPDFVDRIVSVSDRNNRVLCNLHRLFGTGRLAGTGYVSILPVDQG